MGTKVQCTSYLPAFYAMRDLNEDADGHWSQYYEDKTSGTNLYSGYQLRPINGYSEYDKEMLKRTMLEHEAIFRKQVYELHRLYRIQKDMMDELKKGPITCLQDDTSQSNSFSSQIPSEGTGRMFQMTHRPEATPGYKRTPLKLTDDKEPTLNFLNESSVQPRPVSTGKEIFIKDGDLFDYNHKGLPRKTGKEIVVEDDDLFDYNHKGLPRKMFDLQLPADVYIDCEEEERFGKEIVAESSSVTTVPHDRIQDADSENNMKLNFSMGEGPSCREESWKSDKCTQSGPATQSLADLNETAGEKIFGKATGSVSAKFLSPRTPLSEIQGLQLPMRSSTSFSGLPTAFLKGSNGGTTSNHFHVDNDETSREWPLLNNETGRSASVMNLFNPDSSKEKFSMPSEPIQLNQKPHEILSLDQNRRETWFKTKLEISGRSPHYGQTAVPLSNSCTDAYVDYTNAASPLHSSWTKPANGYGCSPVPLAVPLLQYCNGTTNPSHGNPSDKWHCNGGLKSQSKVGVDPTSNAFTHGFRFDQSSASQFQTQPITVGKPNLTNRCDSNDEGWGHQEIQKDVHLNQTLLDGFGNGFTTQKINELEGKCEDFSEAFSWLRRKPTSNASSLMELDFSHGYPQLKSAHSLIDPRYEEVRETGKAINLFCSQDLSSSQVKETVIKRNVASDGQSSKKIFGFPILERTKQTATLSSHQEQSQTIATKNNEEDKLKLSSLETQIPLRDLVAKSSIMSFRNHINLNFDLNSSEISAEDELLEVPFQVSAPAIAARIDLEAPIVLEEKKTNDVSVREAAESILLISLDKRHEDGSPHHSSSLASYNSLHWFAEMVSSNAEAVKETSDDGLDTFEQLTLELEETKPEDYWCRSWEGQEQKEEDDDGKSTIASLLFTKPRRGQARKRRQKRDFQKDILPGLATLSRHEVTEDIQTIGALMKALGQSWQAGGTMRRNANRNGTSSRGRVGRKPRKLVVTEEEIQVRPPPPPAQPAEAWAANDTEVEVDGRNMIGWGRTRQCRRQTFPPATNVAAPLT